MDQQLSPVTIVVSLENDHSRLDYTKWYPTSFELQRRIEAATVAYYQRTDSHISIASRISIPTCPDDLDLSF